MELEFVCLHYLISLFVTVIPWLQLWTIMVLKLRSFFWIPFHFGENCRLFAILPRKCWKSTELMTLRMELLGG